MKNLEFDEKNILRTFTMKGNESIIYLYNDQENYKNNVLLKYFRNKDTEDEIEKFFLMTLDYNDFIHDSGLIIDEASLENKRKKIELIPNIKELNDEVKILDCIYKNNEFKGYTMELEDMKPIDMFSSKRKKIKWLKLLKEKIQLLNSCGIYIGDCNQNNFLVSKDGKTIKLCDLDNLRIGNLDFDSRHNFVNKFENKCKKKEYIDSYCFNMFTISFLAKVVNDIYYIENCNIPNFLNTKENRNIYDSMINLDDSYQYKFLIDNIK